MSVCLFVYCSDGAVSLLNCKLKFVLPTHLHQDDECFDDNRMLKVHPEKLVLFHYFNIKFGRGSTVFSRALLVTAPSA